MTGKEPSKREGEGRQATDLGRFGLGAEPAKTKLEKRFISPRRRTDRVSERPTLPAETARPTKPTARPRLIAHPGPMLLDPRLGVGFGFERTDPGRMTAWDTYLDTVRPVV